MRAAAFFACAFACAFVVGIVTLAFWAPASGFLEQSYSTGGIVPLIAGIVGAVVCDSDSHDWDDVGIAAAIAAGVGLVTAIAVIVMGIASAPSDFIELANYISSGGEHGLWASIVKAIAGVFA